MSGGGGEAYILHPTNTHELKHVIIKTKNENGPSRQWETNDNINISFHLLLPTPTSIWPWSMQR